MWPARLSSFVKALAKSLPNFCRKIARLKLQYQVHWQVRRMSKALISWKERKSMCLGLLWQWLLSSSDAGMSMPATRSARIRSKKQKNSAWAPGLLQSPLSNVQAVEVGSLQRATENQRTLEFDDDRTFPTLHKVGEASSTLQSFSLPQINSFYHAAFGVSIRTCLHNRVRPSIRKVQNREHINLPITNEQIAESCLTAPGRPKR